MRSKSKIWILIARNNINLSESSCFTTSVYLCPKTGPIFHSASVVVYLCFIVFSLAREMIHDLLLDISPPWFDQPLRNICITNYHAYVPFVVITIQSFSHAWLITRFVWRVTWRAPPVEHELLIIPEHLLDFSTIHFAQYSVLYITVLAFDYTFGIFKPYLWQFY